MYQFEQRQLAGLQPSLLLNKLSLPAKTLELLFAKIRILENGCWEWMGAKRSGYGAVKIRALTSSTQQTHRICYQLVNGATAPDVALHHKIEDGCIGPACCNPSHLQRTSQGEHCRDLTPGSSSYIASHRDHCAAGHPYTIESTRVLPNGFRQCRVCDKIRAQTKRDAERVRPKFAKDPAKFKTHCFRNHLLEGENIRMVSSPTGPQRCCLRCEEIRQEFYRERDASGAVDAVNPDRFLNTHCKRGHPMEGDNVYLHPDGIRRSCKACRAMAVTAGAA